VEGAYFSCKRDDLIWGQHFFFEKKNLIKILKKIFAGKFKKLIIFNKNGNPTENKLEKF
jgi:hypothetical protein